MFKLTYKNNYTLKDQKKADICNKYIGFSVEGRSTERYLQDCIAQNIPYNCKFYQKEDIVFVSINGVGYGNRENFIKTILEIERVFVGGGIIVTDNKENAYRYYNNSLYSESGLRDYLIKTYPQIQEESCEFYSKWKI